MTDREYHEEKARTDRYKDIGVRIISLEEVLENEDVAVTLHVGIKRGGNCFVIKEITNSQIRELLQKEINTLKKLQEEI